jgi:hypothetical protein
MASGSTSRVVVVCYGKCTCRTRVTLYTFMYSRMVTMAHLDVLVVLDVTGIKVLPNQPMSVHTLHHTMRQPATAD